MASDLGWHLSSERSVLQENLLRRLRSFPAVTLVRLRCIDLIQMRAVVQCASTTSESESTRTASAGSRRASTVGRLSVICSLLRPSGFEVRPHSALGGGSQPDQPRPGTAGRIAPGISLFRPATHGRSFFGFQIGYFIARNVHVCEGSMDIDDRGRRGRSRPDGLGVVINAVEHVALYSAL